MSDVPELNGIIDIKSVMAVSAFDGRGIHDLQSTLMSLAPELSVWHERVPPSFALFEATLADIVRQKTSLLDSANFASRLQSGAAAHGSGVPTTIDALVSARQRAGARRSRARFVRSISASLSSSAVAQRHSSAGARLRRRAR